MRYCPSQRNWGIIPSHYHKVKHHPSHRNWGIISSLYHKWGITQAIETGELSLHCIINKALPKSQKLGNYLFTVSWMRHCPSHRNWGIIPSLFHKRGNAQDIQTEELSPDCIINETAQATETGELSLHCIINEALPKPQKLGNYPFNFP